MNPITWCKLAYEHIFSLGPTVAFIIVPFVGALFGLLIVQVGKREYEKEQAARPNAPSAAQLPTTGPATTHGDNSPANTGTIGALDITPQGGKQHRADAPKK
jgi:hypothetical protein